MSDTTTTCGSVCTLMGRKTVCELAEGHKGLHKDYKRRTKWTLPVETPEGTMWGTVRVVATKEEMDD